MKPIGCPLTVYCDLYYVDNDSPPMPGDFATTPRAPNIPRTSVGVKRSPQNHRRSMEVDDDRSPERRGGDRKIGSAGKRKRGGYEVD